VKGSWLGRVKRGKGRRKEEGSSLGEENTLLASTGTHLEPLQHLI